ncbi:YmfQ family protein [Paenibacillus sp. HN-1]|uniref:YmfQ family protein n=1 Tax=Paenibacillus TaxID=44249 RepID=UPI001CA8EB74|nr:MULTISPECIES: YmfQ family protein [Paenibacillus]MBY9080987.1 YmfQ family protein [Paenibacillus sp. CGMCC 1.18879]MBY9084089.1 YmfQ family protein [Paenibacillus sinensis]
MSDFAITSPAGQKMFVNLPAYYEKSRVMKANLDASGVEMDQFTKALNEVLDQFFVNSATWSLDIWEQELDLTTDHSKPIDQRRSVVQSKLRGSGKFSGQLVKNVASAYAGGTVDVFFDPPAYNFTVKFIDTLGIPPNLDDLKAAIEEIKPAHMAVEYKYRYLLVREVNVMKINNLQATKMSNFAPFLEQL